MIERHSKALSLRRRVKADVISTSEGSEFIKWEYRDFLCRVDVAIDMDRLIELIGQRAMSNKHKQSRLLKGIITGKVQVGTEIHNGENDKGATGSRDKATGGV
jgi:hypothetical protein